MRRTARLTLAAALSALLAFSCGFDDTTPAWEVGDIVDDYVKVTQYDQSKCFQDDLDALVTYSLDVRAVRWAYYALVSKGGGNNKPFSATMDDIDNNAACKSATQSLYKYIDGIVDRADEYEEMLSRLEATGVLSTPTTRGILSDVFEFVTGCKKAGIVSRKSAITTMRELGWTSNPDKLKELYNTIPSDLRRGYSDHVAFWRDFSAGKLDNRASQIYVNLYTYADLDFGEKARELDITPGKNITVVGAELIEKGASIVIDASPISSQLGYGKDLYGAIDATEKLVKKGDVKGFLQNAANNLVNYGRDAAKLANQMRGLDIIYWEQGDAFWDYVGKDMATIWYNDVCFNNEIDNILNKGEGERLIPNLVKTKDVNGQEITLVVMLDEGTGHVSISYVLDKDGNVITNPQLPGQKKVTVVNRHTGKRTTKPVTVKPDGDTNVDVDLEYDEQLLEEEPENGDLQLSPASISDKEGEGGYRRITIVTNYLYYTCKTDEDWITCNIPSDVNFMYVKLLDNQTGKDRSGKITVAATNSKGKVLKTVVLPVTQKPYVEPEVNISVEPGTLTFTSKEDRQVVNAWLPSGIKSWGAEAEKDLIGWADVTPYLEENTYPAIAVSVAENTTGKDRSGSFYVWASYDEKGKKLDYKTSVKVKQFAAGESGDFTFLIVSTAAQSNCYYDVSKKYYRVALSGGITSPTLTKKGEVFKCTKTDDGYHLFAERTVDNSVKPQYKDRVTISMDIHVADGRLIKVTDVKLAKSYPYALAANDMYLDSVYVKELPFSSTEFKQNYGTYHIDAHRVEFLAKEADKTLGNWYFCRQITNEKGQSFYYKGVSDPAYNEASVTLYYQKN